MTRRILSVAVTAAYFAAVVAAIAVARVAPLLAVGG